MNDILQPNAAENPLKKTEGIIEIANGILLDTKADVSGKNFYSVPIVELSALGAGVSSLSPALRTVTQTMTVDTQGLFRLANAEAGDMLKLAKNGNFWAALKRPDGASKLAQLQPADSLSATITTNMPISPATMMMAVALFSIEQQLESMEEMQRQLLDFLETEKKSEIEADLETLVNLIRKFKYNWDNERFLQSNHKMVIDLQRTSRKNMLFYQKQIEEAISAKQHIVSQTKVQSALEELLHKFRYYRISLYTFSLASFAEILLGGNFKEEYVAEIRQEIESFAIGYRELYGKCSEYLEKLGDSAIDANLKKGFGSASSTVGKWIGSIPKIREGQVDEFLQAKGTRLTDSVNNTERSVLKTFAAISNPGTGILTEKMRELVQIFTCTGEICFDDKRIYLMEE